jgi:hypothetical protein
MVGAPTRSIDKTQALVTDLEHFVMVLERDLG